MYTFKLVEKLALYYFRVFQQYRPITDTQRKQKRRTRRRLMSLLLLYVMELEQSVYA